MLGAEFLNLKGGSQDRVNILQRSLLDAIYIRREDLDRRLFNFQYYRESCDCIKDSVKQLSYPNERLQIFNGNPLEKRLGTK